MPTDIHEYDDIIDLPHPASARHKPMPPEKRAAQFAPFAALTGYEDIVRETARLTDEPPCLDDDEKIRIDAALSFFAAILSAGGSPLVEVTFFRRDERKSGGRYVIARGALVGIDPDARTLRISGFGSVPIDDLTDVRGDLLIFTET